MKPARTTRSGCEASMAAASSFSNSSRWTAPRQATTLVSMPRLRAVAIPAASGLSESTTTVCALISCWIPARAMVAMFEPRPEMRIARRSGGRADSLLDDDTAPALADLADQLRRLPARLQETDGCIGLSGRHDGDHADAAVESTIHLRRLDAPLPLQPLEGRILLPASSLEHHFQTVLQHARNVVGQSASGDVGETANRHGANELQQRFHINTRRGEQTIDQRPTLEVLLQIDSRQGDQLADERVAVGVRSGGGEADDRISGADRAAVDDRVLLHDADTEAGKIV